VKWVAGVFISHASEDLGLADEVRRWLDDDHHEVFLAQDLRGGIAAGEQWRSRLYERLRWADAVVCMVTSASVASTWCTAEVSSALLWGSQLIPMLAEPGVVHPLLGDVQQIELTGDWVAVRAALTEALRRAGAGGGWGWPDGRSPFPGLRAFNIEEHRVFFGRAGEAKQLARLLRSSTERTEGAVLLVVGPSGCGKSSLVQAGLLPMMAREPGWWTLSPIVLGANPMATLVRELASAAGQLHLGWTVSSVRDQLNKVGLTGLVDELLLAARARQLLVVVDQFEELLIPAASADPVPFAESAPTDRVRFVELMRSALAGPVQLVGTLRSEFLDQLLLDSELGTLPTRTYTLRPLRREALRSVIEGPAQLAGIKVGDDLVTQLIEDTEGGEALPLLAFTLAQLAEGLSRGDRLDSIRYDQFGGVRGALTYQANEALADAVDAGGRSREQVIAGLLRLVTVDEEGRRIRRRISLQHVPYPVDVEMDAFVTRRLLIRDTEDGNAAITVAHEAFLTAWAPLDQAVASAAAALRRCGHAARSSMPPRRGTKAVAHLPGCGAVDSSPQPLPTWGHASRLDSPQPQLQQRGCGGHSGC
jgi:energy-coupling factor transporter ATP-binding protein EcfA2